jgi:hypothetical protein
MVAVVKAVVVWALTIALVRVTIQNVMEKLTLEAEVAEVVIIQVAVATVAPE